MSRLATIPITTLQREIVRRQRSLGGLMRKRTQILHRISRIENEIQRHGGDARNLKTRKRPRNKMFLVDALKRVLTGKTMSVTDVSEAVQRAGYRTSSPSFRTIVNQALINSGKFKRVSRGQYTAR